MIDWRNGAKRLATKLGLGLAAAAVSACGGDVPLTNAGFPVTDVGPFEVGYRHLETTYDPMDGQPMRTIRVSVWYPTVDDIATTTTEGHAYTYVLGEMNSFLNAPLRPAAYRDGYPVMVHSHGGSGYADQNYHVAEGMARHGFVVIAPMHEGDTALDILGDVHDLRTHYLRPMDLRAALDLLASGLPSNDPLYGRCATDDALLSSHSNGSEAAMALLGAPFSRAYRETECTNGVYAAAGGCPVEQLARFDVSHRDPRFVAAVMAGGDGESYAFVGDTGAFAALTTPMLFIEGSEDDSYPNTLAMVPTFTVPDARLFTITGGCHTVAAGGGCTNITEAEAWPIINDYYRAFARNHLFGDVSASVVGLLDGTTSLSSKVVYTP